MTLLIKIPGAFTDPTLPVFGGDDVWFRDTFTRTDSSSLGGTEDAHHRPWSTWVTSGTPVAGIANNEAYAYRAEGSGHTVTTVDATSANGTLTATQGTAASGAQFGAVFRASDVNNYYRVVNAQGAEYRLQKFVAGASTVLGAASGVKPAAGDVIAVALSGASIIVYVNGTAKITASDSHNVDATRHGFYNNVQGSTIRDVAFTV